MAKKQNWIDRLKKFFSSETQSKQEKVTDKLKVILSICVRNTKMMQFRKPLGIMLQKERRRRWLFGRLKPKCPPALPAPSLRRLRSLREAEQEQSKHAVAVAVATAAAAEAAVAAAQAAALVVRLTGNPSSCHQTRETASVKIQTAFRGYLARRALRALKGLVKLQALIRGQAVRRQTNITLKGLQSLMKIQSQARANRMKAALMNRQPHEVEDVFHQKTMTTNKETGDSQADYVDRKWDGSILSKEEIVVLLKKRQYAVSRRERAADYATTHQERRHARRPTISSNHELETSSTVKPITWSWLEHWAGAQTLDKDIPEVSPMPCQEGIAACNKKLHASESLLSFLESAHEGKAEELQLPNYFARRSFNRSGRAPPKDDDSFSASPYPPSYMASTASTKAKFRSMSTPKQRHGTLDHSDQCSLNKDRPFSPLPSVKIAPNHQRSPRLRGHACPAAKHSIESELSLLTWDKHSPFR